MKTLKVVLQEVVSGLKSWVNTNTVHKTGNETINGVKIFSDGIVSDVTGSATSVPWSGVTGKPSDYPPSSHTHTKSQITDFPALANVATSGSYNDLNNIPTSFTPSSHKHGNLTNDGKLGTASRALVTDSSKKIAVSTVTSTELGYLSGVTSAIQTQLNGKAASTHVHGNISNDGKVGTTANLPLITGTGGVIQAGSFGNAANTFCEGNDSRLSDARTPVAHTHGKADITDLFNSANTWTGDNIFNKPIQVQKTSGATEIEIKNLNVDITNNTTTSEVDDIRFLDKNAKITGGVRLTYDNTKVTQRVYVRSYSSNGESSAQVALELKSDQQNSIKEATISSDLLPATNSSYNLGTSSYQWNNLYAKNYFYNGTAWGLDKSNVWTADQTIAASKFLRVYGYRFQIKNDSMVLGTVPSSNQWTGMQFVDKNETPISEIIQSFQSNGNSLYQINVWTNEANSEKRSIIAWGYNSTNSVNNVSFSSNLTPQNSNTYNLGTTTNRWKTLNGINPGALSLPDYNNVLDVTSEIPVASLDGNTQININDYIPNKTGWLSIVIADTAGNSIIATQGRSGGSTAYNNSRTFHTGAQSNGYISVFFPILADMNKFVSIKASSLIQMRFYYCLGNV